MSRVIHLAARNTPLSAEQQKLVIEAQPVVKKAARRAKRRTPGMELGEIEAMGQIGAVEAAQTYKLEEPCPPFKIYAWSRIVGAIKNGLKRYAKQTRLLHYAGDAASGQFAEVHLDPGNVLYDSKAAPRRQFRKAMDGFLASKMMGFVSAIYRLEGEEAIVARQMYAHTIKVLHEEVSALPERDRIIVEFRYYEGITLAVVATKVGVSKATMKRRHHDAMVRLGGRLRARGIKGGTTA
jgi:RNA polymerase sigma factor for flagellar operon FliA